MGRKKIAIDRIRGPYKHPDGWYVEIIRPGRKTKSFYFSSSEKAEEAKAIGVESLLATAKKKRDRPRHGTDVVYFITVNGGPIKIGRARDVQTRLRDLQQAHWHPITLLATVSGVNEKSLHRRFAHLRIRGEWFTAAAELLAFIESISSVESYGSGTA